MANEIISTADETSVSLLEQAESVIREGLQTFFEVGNALADIRDEKRYKLRGYSKFEDYCTGEWQIGQSQAYRIMGAAAVVADIKSSPIGEKTQLPMRETHARPLITIEPIDRPKAWEEATKRAESEGVPVAARHVEAVVAEVKASKLPAPSPVNPSRQPPVSVASITNPAKKSSTAEYKEREKWDERVPVPLKWSGEIRRAYYEYMNGYGDHSNQCIEIETRTNDMGTFYDTRIDNRPISTTKGGMEAAQQKIALFLSGDKGNLA